MTELADFGRYLKQQRELRGLSVDDVVKATRIPPTLVGALETGHGERFPERVFVVNYIKSYARVVGLSPDDARLYVAETHTGRLWAFDLEAPGVVTRRRYPSPNGGELVAGLPGYQLFDSLALEAGGKVCVATLFNGGITLISPDGRDIEHLPLPDDYTTNLCFGGPDLRTAYVTLSSSGQLVALEWPRPGLALNFRR